MNTSRPMSQQLRFTALMLCFVSSLAGTGVASANLIDNFDRADAGQVGNGWLEKNPGGFTLSAGEVVKQSVTFGYRDNAVYRPGNEDLLDVETSVELSFVSLPPGYPQIFARLQSATADAVNALDAYMLYVNDATGNAVLGRQRGSAFVTALATLPIGGLNTTDRYRLRLRVTGSAPVELAAYVERLAGAQWEILSQAQVSDNSAERIDGAGSVGFGGYIESSYVYDNFRRTDLGPGGNPIPVADALSPSQATAGGSAFTLTVTGSGFVPGSIVQWNGLSRETSYVSPGELQATIPDTDIATAGTAMVTVVSPGPGGGVSEPVTFTVDSGVPPNPVPVISLLSPGTASVGGSAFGLDVLGSGFTPNSIVRWNGIDRATTFLGDTQLQAAIADVDIASPGTAAVTVFTPGPGGGTSNSQAFTIVDTGSTYMDTFTRADGENLGSGWIEKTPNAFFLSGDEVYKQASAQGYRDTLVYRPASEDLRDVEASVELRFVSLPAGYPQIHVRIQSDTVANVNELDSYIFYVDDATGNAILGRQNGSTFLTSLATLPIGAVNTTDRYRMRLRATGADPVALTAYFERLGVVGWEVVSQASYNDVAAQRITGPGSVGFGAYIESSYIYDNFVRTDLGDGTYPQPVLNSISPSTAVAGAGDFVVIVSGGGFSPESIVRWNGTDRQTEFVSGGELWGFISQDDVAVSGTSDITVFTPEPGGGLSNSLGFTILDPGGGGNPVPVLSTLSPASAPQGSGALSLTVAGSGFTPDSVVQWNGVSRATTFLSSTALQATITSGDLTTAGVAQLTVFTPAPGGGVSNTLSFDITPENTGDPNPVPVLTSLEPGSATAGNDSFNLRVSGAEFVQDSEVLWNGAPRSTSFVSATELIATIPASDITAPGSAIISVFSPAPDGGTSSSQTFLIGPSDPPTLSLDSMSPSVATAGSSDLLVSLFGQGFAPDSIVRWNGGHRPTTVVSPSEVQVIIPASDLATPATAAVSVFSASEGASGPLSFLVLESGATGFFDAFNRSDSEDLGNGWTEKVPAVYSIENGEVVGIPTDVLPNEYTYVFRDTIVHRPAAEDRRDVETSIEFIRQTDGGWEFPQLHARIQRDSAQDSNALGSYILYLEDNLPGSVAIAVLQPNYGEGECILSLFNLSRPIVSGERYRLRFRVEGEFPVYLEGGVDYYDGQRWESIGQGSVTHGDDNGWTYYCDPGFVPPPISGAGGTGFAKWWTETQVYDNFYWRSAGPPTPNPAPDIDRLSPSWALAGDADTAFTVTGNGFASGASVRWDGIDLQTTYVSETTLRAVVPASNLTATGIGTITVFNPGPGGGTSQATVFQVYNLGASFSDDFERPDGGLGNGWTSKRDAFGIGGGEVVKSFGLSGSMRDNVSYRPASEEALDSESSVEFRLLSDPPGLPQLLSRIQTSTVAIMGTLDAYALQVNDELRKIVLTRMRGSSSYRQLATISLAAPLSVGERYRLRMSLTGASPVALTAHVERFTGGGWEVLGTALYEDSDPEAIVDPGVSGFTGDWEENRYVFDNFEARALTP